jgi:RecA-family ATPase
MRDLCQTRDFVILDPLSMLLFDDLGKKQWESQERFAKDLAAIAMQTQTRLFIVHHTRKSAPGLKVRQTNLDEAAGSAGIVRFADNVLFLEHYHEGIDSEVMDEYGIARDVRHKRVLFIAKARDGEGTGWRIACDLSESGPALIEHGCIRSKK